MNIQTKYDIGDEVWFIYPVWVDCANGGAREISHFEYKPKHITMIQSFTDSNCKSSFLYYLKGWGFPVPCEDFCRTEKEAIEEVERRNQSTESMKREIDRLFPLWKRKPAPANRTKHSDPEVVSTLEAGQ